MERLDAEATVVLLIDTEDRVCLARKKKAIHKDHGEISYSLGMWNGYGGKREDLDRDILDTAKRELEDESGVMINKDDLKIVARVLFCYNRTGSEDFFMTVSFFLLRHWQGEPHESDEMGIPTFFAPSDIPYDEMMPADKVLFQKILRGEKFVAKVVLGEKGTAPEITLLDEIL